MKDRIRLIKDDIFKDDYPNFKIKLVELTTNAIEKNILFDLCLFAIEMNRLRMVDAFLETSHFDINYTDSKSGKTLLMDASRWNRVDIIKSLLEKGARYDITHKNSGKTALDYAPRERFSFSGNSLYSRVHAASYLRDYIEKDKKKSQEQQLKQSEKEKVSSIRDIKQLISAPNPPFTNVPLFMSQNDSKKSVPQSVLFETPKPTALSSSVSEIKSVSQLLSGITSLKGFLSWG